MPNRLTFGATDSNQSALEPPPDQSPNLGGKPLVADQLFAALYLELHGMAELRLRRSGRDLAVSTTTLANEIWLDMSAGRDLASPSRPVMAYAAQAMRAVVCPTVLVGLRLRP